MNEVIYVLSYVELEYHNLIFILIKFVNFSI